MYETNGQRFGKDVYSRELFPPGAAEVALGIRESSKVIQRSPAPSLTSVKEVSS